MHKFTIPLLLFLIWATPSHAQTNPALVGNCAMGTAESYLDVGNVRARLFNNGALFWRGDPSVYEVPKGSGIHSIFSSVLWIGGLVNNEIRTAASTYGPYEFWPGPISSTSTPPENCESFDQIWTIDRSTDLTLLEQGSVTSNVANWPTELGAPFENVDGTPGYQPENGDQPIILGDQMHWWLMNDIGNEHTRTQTNPLGIEARVSAYAFSRQSELDNITFYKYQITNRSFHTISQTYIGMVIDADLGAILDDYFGSDSTLSLAYFYNADNDDNDQYGIAPPAQGISIIEASHSKGGLPSDTGAGPGSFMTAARMYHGGGGNFGDPGWGSDIYQFMQSHWKDGTPITCGGQYGYGFSTKPCPFMFPGDPVSGTFWSERNIDGNGIPSTPADRRGLLALGPFDLGPEENATFTFAFIWARGDSNLDSITHLKKLTAGIHSVKQDLLNPLHALPKFINNNPPAPPQHSFWLAPIYPNPSSNRATIDYSLILDGVTEITVYDVLSRQVFSMDQGLQTAGRHDVTIDTSDLKAGVYTVRLHSNRQTATRLLAVTR